MRESEASSLGEKMGLMDRTDVSINSRMGDYGACVCHEEASQRAASAPLPLLRTKTTTVASLSYALYTQERHQRRCRSPKTYF